MKNDQFSKEIKAIVFFFILISLFNFKLNNELTRNKKLWCFCVSVRGLLTCNLRFSLVHFARFYSHVFMYAFGVFAFFKSLFPFLFHLFISYRIPLVILFIHLIFGRVLLAGDRTLWTDTFIRFITTTENEAIDLISRKLHEIYEYASHAHTHRNVHEIRWVDTHTHARAHQMMMLRMRESSDRSGGEQ